MSVPVNPYDTSYENYAAQLYREVQRETYGEDVGQTGWMAIRLLGREAVITRLAQTCLAQTRPAGADVCDSSQVRGGSAAKPMSVG